MKNQGQNDSAKISVRCESIAQKNAIMRSFDFLSKNKGQKRGDILAELLQSEVEKTINEKGGVL